MMRRNTTLTPLELEAEVKKMLGNSPPKSGLSSPGRIRKPYTPFEVDVDHVGDVTINMSGKALHTLAAPEQPASASLDYDNRHSVGFADQASNLKRTPEPFIADRPSIVTRAPDRSILDRPASATRTPDKAGASTSGNGPDRPSSATRSAVDITGDRPSSATRSGGEKGVGGGPGGDRSSRTSRSVPAVAVDQAAMIPGSTMGSERGGGSGGSRSSGTREEGVVVEERKAMPWEENFVDAVGSGSGSERGGLESFRSDGTTSRRSDGSGSLAPARVLPLKPVHRMHQSPPPFPSQSPPLLPPQSLSPLPQPTVVARSGVQPLRSSAQLPPTGALAGMPSPAAPGFHH